MNVSSIASLVTTAVVAGGVGFAVIQIRDARRVQASQAAIAFAESMQTRDVSDDIMLLISLPTGGGPEEWSAVSDDIKAAAHRMASKCETIGVLVHEHVLSFDLVSELIPVDYLWARLRPMALGMREELGSHNFFEWFQWLAEQMEDSKARQRSEPAFEAFRDWRR